MHHRETIHKQQKEITEVTEQKKALKAVIEEISVEKKNMIDKIDNLEKKVGHLELIKKQLTSDILDRDETIETLNEKKS